jgi:hypothetical protein
VSEHENKQNPEPFESAPKPDDFGKGTTEKSEPLSAHKRRKVRTGIKRTLPIKVRRKTLTHCRSLRKQLEHDADLARVLNVDLRGVRGELLRAIKSVFPLKRGDRTTRTLIKHARWSGRERLCRRSPRPKSKTGTSWSRIQKCLR